jgi:hypothetical protein
MTIPYYIEEPLTWKRVQVPYEIVHYCDAFNPLVDREDLEYVDCVWMHMGYYGVPKHVMKAVRQEWDPNVIPVFE